MKTRKTMKTAAVIAVVLGAVLAGCRVPPTPPTPVNQKYEIDPATNRGYYIYVPSTYRKDRPAPLIVTCHGTPPFDIAEHHIREWRYYGELNGCIVVAPELAATDGLLGDGPIVGMLGCERRIMSLISLLSYRYNIDRANIMITGFSGGGFPTYWVGMRHPDVFSAVVARSCNFSQGNLHGWYPLEARKQAVFVYYGSNDPATIQEQSNAAVRYLRSQGFVVSTKVLPGVGHERHPDVAMRFFRQNWRRTRSSQLSQATR